MKNYAWLHPVCHLTSQKRRRWGGREIHYHIVTSPLSKPKNNLGFTKSWSDGNGTSFLTRPAAMCFDITLLLLGLLVMPAVEATESSPEAEKTINSRETFTSKIPILPHPFHSKWGEKDFLFIICFSLRRLSFIFKKPGCLSYSFQCSTLWCLVIGGGGFRREITSFFFLFFWLGFSLVSERKCEMGGSGFRNGEKWGGGIGLFRNVGLKLFGILEGKEGEGERNNERIG